jgi:cytoskeleton protein RodZ
MATEENSQPAMKEPAGRQLQKAREAAGLSVGDVAGAQHLRPSVIQAIESGDYSQIDSELFLKGYVRAYAKQVGLDADTVIADLDQELEPIRQQREQEYEANPLVDIERRRRRKRQLGKTLFFLVVLGIAGYLAFAFLMPDQDANQGPAETAKAPEAAGQGQNEGAEISAPAEEVASAEEERSESPVPGGDQGSTGSVNPVADQSAPDAEPGAADSQQVASVGAEEPPGEPIAEQIPTVVQTPEPVLENPSGLADDSAMARLQIQFTGDCWVQVSDADGNRLVNSLQRAGDSIDVSGEAPLKVVIGAVDAVSSITFEGEPLDLDSYRVVNNRSEFTLTI